MISSTFSNDSKSPTSVGVQHHHMRYGPLCCANAVLPESCSSDGRPPSSSTRCESFRNSAPAHLRVSDSSLLSCVESLVPVTKLSTRSYLQMPEHLARVPPRHWNKVTTEPSTRAQLTRQVSGCSLLRAQLSCCHAYQLSSSICTPNTTILDVRTCRLETLKGEGAKNSNPLSSVSTVVSSSSSSTGRPSRNFVYRAKASNWEGDFFPTFKPKKILGTRRRRRDEPPRPAFALLRYAPAVALHSQRSTETPSRHPARDPFRRRHVAPPSESNHG